MRTSHPYHLSLVTLATALFTAPSYAAQDDRAHETAMKKAGILDAAGHRYCDEGKYKQAEESYKKAHKIKLEALGERHADVAASYNNLGLFYNNQRRYKEAEEHYKKALEIGAQALDKNHPLLPLLASFYSNLGTVKYEQGSYKKALEYFEKALAIQLDKLGKDHPCTQDTQAWVKKNRALLYNRRTVAPGV